MNLQSISLVKTANSIQPVRLKCTVFGLLCFSTMQYQRVEGHSLLKLDGFRLLRDTHKRGAGLRKATSSSVHPVGRFDEARLAPHRSRGSGTGDTRAFAA